MRIGLDVDGVLADLAGATVWWLNIQNEEKAGVAGSSDVPRLLTVEDVVHYHFLREQMGSQEKLLTVMDTLYERGLVKPQEPLLIERFEELNELGHSITVITRRTRPSHPDVASWLLNQGLMYNTLIFMDWTGDKLAYPIDVLLDDHPNMVQAAKEHSEKTVFLRDQPWNRDLIDTENLIRVFDFGDMIVKLEEVTRG